MQFHACLSNNKENFGLREKKLWTKVMLSWGRRYRERHFVIVTIRLDLGQSLYQAMLKTLKNKAKTPPLFHVYLYFLTVDLQDFLSVDFRVLWGISSFIMNFEFYEEFRSLTRKIHISFLYTWLSCYYCLPGEEKCLEKCLISSLA